MKFSFKKLFRFSFVSRYRFKLIIYISILWTLIDLAMVLTRSEPSYYSITSAKILRAVLVFFHEPVYQLPVGVQTPPAVQAPFFVDWLHLPKPDIAVSGLCGQFHDSCGQHFFYPAPHCWRSFIKIWAGCFSSAMADAKSFLLDVAIHPHTTDY